MKITNAKLIELNRGIGTLDIGHDVTVDGKNVRRPYRYGGSTVHFPLQQNAMAIKPHVEAFTKANQALFASYASPYTNERGEPAQRVQAEKVAEYKAECEKLLQQVVQVRLYAVKLSDLKVGTGDNENPIPVQTITDLHPIIKDDTARDQLVEVLDDEAKA